MLDTMNVVLSGMTFIREHYRSALFVLFYDRIRTCSSWKIQINMLASTSLDVAWSVLHINHIEFSGC